MLKHGFRLTVSEDAGSGRISSTPLNPLAPVFVPRSPIPRDLRPIAPIFVPRWQIHRPFNNMAPVFVPGRIAEASNRIDSNHTLTHTLA